MTALLKPRDVDPSARGQTVIDDFIRDGAHLFDAPVDPAACARLLADIRATREFGRWMARPAPISWPGSARPATSAPRCS
jgi:hypothetical protein